MTKTKKTVWVSIVLIILFLFMCLIYREEIYQKQIQLKKSAEIIMFGDSHTAIGKWNFLLNTNPVLRSGWGGYTTEMLLTKISSMASYNPKYIFILCGGNDIYAKNFSVKNTMDNFRIMADTLKNNNRTPVFQKLIYQHNNPEFNKIVDSINISLTDYCKKEHIDIIDISNQMYDSSGLKESLTTDNLHLNKKGYILWSKVINNFLKNKQ
jgi:lysophospholipase L1-like esterase